MKNPLNKPPNHQPAQKNAAEEYAEMVSPQQREVFEAIANIMRRRTGNRGLDLDTSLPLVRTAIETYIKTINDPDGISTALDWVNEEFRVFGESFSFEPDEEKEIRDFLNTINTQFRNK